MRTPTSLILERLQCGIPLMPLRASPSQVGLRIDVGSRQAPSASGCSHFHGIIDAQALLQSCTLRAPALGVPDRVQRSPPCMTLGALPESVSYTHLRAHETSAHL
eukprot:15447957-Alexandrium_andersonii.AAC.1